MLSASGMLMAFTRLSSSALLHSGDSCIFPLEYFPGSQGSGLECVVAKKHLKEFWYISSPIESH